MTKGPRLWLSKHAFLLQIASSLQNTPDMRTLLTSFLALWMVLVHAQGTICDQVQANFIPLASNSTVQFSNATTGTGAGTLFFWTFGDGTSSQDAQPLHDYPEGGVYEVCLTVVTILTGANGQPLTCQDVQCSAVTIGGQEPCSPNFVVAMDWIPQGNNEVTFVATSTFPNTNFIWYFGDGTEAYGSTADHTYAQAGTYAVCVTGWYYNESAQDTCWIEDCASVVVDGQLPCDELFACFQPSQLSTAGFFFNNCSSAPFGSDLQFLWNFGDGTLSTEPAPIHTFPANGVYAVCLTAYWGDCADSTCLTITVGDGNPCDLLDPEFTPFVGGLGVNMQNAVINNEWTYLWTFGDGSTGYGPSTGHQYTAPGTYDICLTVYAWDPVAQDTCFADHCETVIIGAQTCDPNFAVELAWNVGNDNAVFFNATSNHPNTNFIWYFGDGMEAYGPVAQHTYAQEGTYYPCVTGWYYNEATQDTCWIEDCEWVVVEGSSPCDGVNACFVTNDLGDQVFFFDNCSNEPSGSQYLWTFGDGTSSTVENAEHTFPGPGIFEVCLSVFWDDCVDSTCVTITVGSGNPCDLLDAGFTPFVGGLGVNIQNAVINNEWTYLWTFGDGTTGYGPSTGHQYTAPGTYDICLTVYTWDPVAQDTCFADHCETVIIGAQTCDPSFAVEMAWNAGNDNVVFFNATSNHPNTNFIWYFGDGTEAYGPAAQHTYAQEGTYYPCVTGWYYNEATQDTCWIEDCETILIGEQSLCDELVACFEALPFENGAYLFENCSQLLPIDIPAYYFWDFGDGSTSTDAAPTHSFGPGIHTVCLTITHGDCVDTTCTTITVNGGGPECDPNFSAGFNYQVQNNAVIFFANFDTPTMGVIWTFPDGAQAYEPIHTHLFEPPGPFEVCLSSWYWNEQTQDTCWAYTCQLIDPFNTVNSVGELDASAINAFPIPAHDQLTITGLPARANLQLFSPDGRLVRSAQPTSDTHRMPVQDLATGTYLLVVQSNGERAHRRVVVE
jgi:PKD repeat protein